MPKRMLAAGVLTILTAASPAGAESQSQHRHKWWQDAEVKLELGLTEQQSAEVEQTFQASLPMLRDQKRQLEGLEEDLSRMIKERQADEPVLAALIDRVEAARSQLSKERTLMLYRMHRILTPAQNEKLKAMNERRSRERRKREQP